MSMFQISPPRVNHRSISRLSAIYCRSDSDAECVSQNCLHALWKNVAIRWLHFCCTKCYKWLVMLNVFWIACLLVINLNFLFWHTPLPVIICHFILKITRNFGLPVAVTKIWRREFHRLILSCALLTCYT